MRPLSNDLRERVVAAVGSGASCRSVAARFGVAASTVVKWSQRYRTTGSVAPGKVGGHRKPVLNAHRAFIRERIDQTPHLDWLLLTKRIGNVRKMTAGRLPGNAAIGATIANQEEYNRDAVKLAEVRAALRPLFSFGSFEPLLGPIALNDLAPDWIIVGGETSQGAHRARLMPSEWPRAMSERAAHLNRAFFMKQMTDKHPIPLDLLVREYPVECQR